jgi:peptidoglycan/xylan/chitin deacetylase (PgdA/CDA1 family)
MTAKQAHAPDGVGPSSRAERRHLAVLSAMALVGYLVTFGVASAAAATTTVVSITFDDGRASQSAALPILAEHGMKSTFYLNSGRLDSPGFLTGAQVSSIAAAGHEIGGHTHLHEDLTTLTPQEASATVCSDRSGLVSRGFAVQSFAYPFGAANATVKAVVESCGYQSARGVGGLRGTSSCQGCPTSELIPPRDRWYVATPDSVKDTTTLAQLQSSVNQARANGGGWVPLVLHDVGISGPLAISTATLDAFLDWLVVQPDTVVKTVAGALGTTSPPPPPPPPPPLNQMLNPSLEAGPDTPTCYWRSGYGTNTFAWSRSSDAVSGTSQRVNITALTNGDRKLVPALDAGQAAGGCAPNVTPGASYNLGIAYKATRAVYLVTYYRDAGGVWQYWQTGPGLPATAAFVPTTWTTPPVPVGATAISFGVALTGVGSLNVDNFSMNAK